MPDNAKSDSQRDSSPNLRVAIWNKDTERMFAQISANPSVVNTSVEGRLPLSETNNISIAKFLIAAGANVNARDDVEGCTPLHRVVSREMADLLIKSGADINAKSDAGLNALYYVEDPDALKVLLKAGVDAKATGKDGVGVLHDRRASKEKVEILVKAGANVNAVESSEGDTPLHTVHHEGAVEALIKAGANVNATNKKGQTPLHCSQVKPEHALVLIREGANVNARDNNGRTPLHNAALSGPSNSTSAVKTIVVLIEAGAKVGEKDNGGHSAMEYIRELEISVDERARIIKAMETASEKMSAIKNPVKDEPLAVMAPRTPSVAHPVVNTGLGQVV